MRLVRLSALVLGIALGGSLPAAAWGAPPVVVEATVQRGEVSLLGEPRVAGRTTHVEFTETATVSGGVFGPDGQPLESQFRCVYVGTESLVCHGEQVFTGTIEGRSLPGTTMSKVRFVCSQETFLCEGSSTVIGADGGLTGIRGRSTFTANLLTGTSDVTMRLVGV